MLVCVNHGSKLLSLGRQPEDGRWLFITICSLMSLKVQRLSMFEYKGGRKGNSWKESRRRHML